MRHPSTCDCDCNKASINDEYLDIENYSCKKRLLGKLVLVSEDEILNTTETSLDDKKCEKKNNWLIHAILLLIICLLLLVVISISCRYKTLDKGGTRNIEFNVK